MDRLVLLGDWIGVWIGKMIHIEYIVLNKKYKTDKTKQKQKNSGSNSFN